MVVVVALILASSASAGRYTVRRGDTLGAIAARNRSTVAALAKLNGLRDPDVIRIGQTLRLAGSGVADASPPSRSLSPALIAASTGPAGPGHHIVEPGETIATVASHFGVSPVALAAANGITNGMLYAGARIRVDVSPRGALPSPGYPFVAQPIHIVVPGDSLSRIAQRNRVAASTLASFNGVSRNVQVQIGDRLVIPGRWRCPVVGRVSFMNDWGFSRLGGDWHEGIDLLAPRGTPVIAPVSGPLDRYPNPKGGNAFELHGDDGIRYYGAHLDRYGHVGMVTAGTVIGYVGNTGDAAGGATHLHLEIHPGGGAAVPPYPTVALACR